MTRGLGSGNSGQFTFLDIITLVSFLVGLMNLDENLTQGDKQELMQELSNKSDQLLSEIHRHLETQDAQLQAILRRLDHEHDEEAHLHG